MKIEENIEFSEHHEFQRGESKIAKQVAIAFPDYKVFVTMAYLEKFPIRFKIDKKEIILTFASNRTKYPSPSDVSKLIKEITSHLKYLKTWEDFSLDDLIKKQFPNGYDMCHECGAYFHHPFRWCPTCGTRTHKEKEMSWRKFLVITAHHGSGPLNTIFTSLVGGWDWEALKSQPEKLKIYEEAKQIWKDNGGDAPFVRGEEEKKCPKCGHNHSSLYSICYMCRIGVLMRLSEKARRGEKLTAEERLILRTIKKDWKKIVKEKTK